MEQGPGAPERRGEQRFWSALISAEIDSWQPQALPATFRPRDSSERRGRRLLPVLAAVVVLVLVAIAVISNVPRGLVSSVVNIGRHHPSAAPSDRLPATTRAPRPSDAAAGGRPPSTTVPESVPQGSGPSPTVPSGASPASSGSGGQPEVPAAPMAPMAPPTLPSLPVGTPPVPPLPSPPLPPLPSAPLPSLPVGTPPLPPLPPPPLPPPPLPSPPLPPLPSVSPPVLPSPVPPPPSLPTIPTDGAA